MLRRREGWTFLRIDHDKVSGALYIKLRDGAYDHTEDFSERAAVYLDVDAEGNVLGVEALSSGDLTQAIEERGGKLDVPERVEKIENFVGYFHVYEDREHPGEYRWEFRSANSGVAWVRTSHSYRNREELERSMNRFRAYHFAAEIGAEIEILSTTWRRVRRLNWLRFEPRSSSGGNARSCWTNFLLYRSRRS
jgi:uncharacterized protein YuzE